MQTQDVRSGDTSYLSLQEFAWPKLYDESIVETIEYLNMIVYMEFPATTESWYMNKQSPEVRNQRLSDILNSAIIEADVSYTDGMHKTDYYKIETDGTTRYNLYKCEGN